jgi:sugar lactone lactonase YvrE
MTPSILIPTDCELGEGPMWHSSEKVLYWVDILQKKLHRFNPQLKKHQFFQFDKMPGAVVPSNLDAHLMISFEDGIAQFNLHTQLLRYMVKFHENQPNMRANDGKCDPFGNFWVGTMSKTCEDKAGALYCLKADGSFEKKIENITISNGLCWSPDHKTMYYIDTFAYNVKAYDCDVSGNLSNERVVIDAHQPEWAYLDGMTIDTEGMLWIAHCTGSCIRRWNPHSGKVLATYQLSVPKVTSLAFGGEHYDTLYITTAQEHMTAEALIQYPESGHVFMLKTKQQGFATSVYRI